MDGSPTKLEDDDEWNEVGNAGPLRGDGAAAHTLIKNEVEGKQYTQCA